MRFFEDGPAIPDTLLEQSDAGNVVFFCGAGVSCYPKSQGQSMPTFEKLTKKVVEHLSPSPKSKAGEWIEKRRKGEDTSSIPLNEVFDELKSPRSFGKKTVHEEVANILSSEKMKGQDLSQHRHIAQISRTEGGFPRVVTTNFDVLFEKAVKDRKMKIHLPPIEIESSSDFLESGITYLHGRVPELTEHISKEKNINLDLILSTSDFGKAYFLKDPWASSFIHALFSNYTIVFIGYRASDVPIHFMLSGMRDSEESGMQKEIYVFDKGQLEELNEKWRSRGVQPIPYSSYKVLWKTIQAWAERSINSRRWKKSVLKMAQVDPRTLKPHERGQVSHVIRTLDGIDMFAKLNQPAHPRWVSVFDQDIRLGMQFFGRLPEEFGFAPQSVYGLDGESSTLEASKIGQSVSQEKYLCDKTPNEYPQELDDKLIETFRKCQEAWICGNINSPVMAWWIARKFDVRSSLLSALKLKLDMCVDMDPKVQLIWNIILEYHKGAPHASLDNEWISFCFYVKKNGWTESTFKKFKMATTPRLGIAPVCDASRFDLPYNDWNIDEFEKVVNFVVTFPDRLSSDFDIDDDSLLPVIKIIQDNLLLASEVRSRLRELYGGVTETATCYPYRDVCGDSRYVEFHEEMSWFLELYKRLIDLDPAIAKDIAKGWKFDNIYFFRKLKLFALNINSLFIIDEVYSCINQLSEREFWCENSRRELLFLLADRWIEFSEHQQQKLAKKIVSPPYAIFKSCNDNSSEIAKRHVAVYAIWLIENGCEFPESSTRKLSRIIESLKDWNDNYAKQATRRLYSISITMGVDEDPTPLEYLPFDQVIAEADRIDQSDREAMDIGIRKPFSGLAEDDPEKALFALIDAGTKGQYPVDYWRALVDKWSADVSVELSKKFLEQLIELPLDVLIEIKNELGRYLRDRHHSMFSVSSKLSWEVFDRCIMSWVKYYEAPHDSNECHDVWVVSNGGSSKRTYGYALTRPVGMAVLFLMEVIGSRSKGIPDEVKHRLEDVLKSSGEGCHCCVSILAYHISALYQLDRVWVKKNLIPLLKQGHELEEAALNGLIYSPILSVDLFEELKCYIMGIFPYVYKFDWNDSYFCSCAHRVVEAGTIHIESLNCTEKIQVTDCIRNMREYDRINSILYLKNVGEGVENELNRYIVPFFKYVWPKDQPFQNEEVTRFLMELISNAGDDFPDVFSAVRRFLVPIGEDSYVAFDFALRGGREDGPIVRFPSEALDLLDILIVPETGHAPLLLGKILSLLSEADKSLEGDNRYIRLLDLSRKTKSR